MNSYTEPVPAWWPQNPPIYDTHKSYEENAEQGPFFSGDIPKRKITNKSNWTNFLGIPVASKIGVPAGPLLNSKWTSLAANLGFDIVTYKTIRSKKHIGHPHPNVVYVETNGPLHNKRFGETLTQAEHQPTNLNNLAITNSFGMPSPDNDFLFEDIKIANQNLKEGQLLIVSVVGTPRIGEPFIADFVQTAKLAKAAGAKIIEANFSCPNVCTKEGSIYTNPDTVYDIASNIVKAIGNTPLIIKVGVFNNQSLLRKVMLAAARAGVQAINGINTVGMKVVNKENKPALGPNREKSGICGSPIRNCALDFVQQARLINVQEKLGLTIIGVGGVTLPEHFSDLLNNGADIAMSATGMMWDPYLAMRYHNRIKENITITPKNIVQPRLTPKTISHEKEKLILDLHKIGALKFGEFTLKNGTTSPIYIDLRVTISHPHILQKISDQLVQTSKSLNYDLICGIPYTALPIATLMSRDLEIPMVVRRKEAKKYGTKKIIEGNFSAGQTCLIVDDMITDGASKFESIEPLENQELQVKDIIVLIDRKQGGKENLQKKGYNLHKVLTLQECLDTLLSNARISQKVYADTLQYLRANNYNKPGEQPMVSHSRHPLSWEVRCGVTKNDTARYLCMTASQKESNLILAADVTTCEELIELVEKVGPYICVLKTHIDILEDFTPEITKILSRLAQMHGFLIFEDRKFADIGKTVKRQYEGGIYKISSWADLVNAHSIPGPGIIQGLKKIGIPKKRALILLAEMSSKGNLATNEYAQKTREMAEAHKDFVIGYIGQSRKKDTEGQVIFDDSDMFYMTPGVNLSSTGDKLGQQYITPEVAITQNGSDFIIVGSGIHKAANPREAAEKYRKAAWNEYLKRIS